MPVFMPHDASRISAIFQSIQSQFRRLALIRRMVYGIPRAARHAQATGNPAPRLKQQMRRAAYRDDVRTFVLKVFGAS